MMGEPLYCGVGRRVERRCEAWGIHMYIFMYDWVRINQSQGGKIPQARDCFANAEACGENQSHCTDIYTQTYFHHLLFLFKTWPSISFLGLQI